MAKIFDSSYYQQLQESRKIFFESFLPQLVKQSDLKTALDAGCGLGFFSGYLKSIGLTVTAFDGREENVAEARTRNPGVDFFIKDIEDPSIPDLGQFDLVLCSGVLQHLENPFRALRNLYTLTGKVLLLEGVMNPSRSLNTILCEEEKEPYASLRYVAQVPSGPWTLKVLYRVGFPFVYRTKTLPDHHEFRPHLLRKKVRSLFVASKTELSHPDLILVAEPERTNRYMWYRFGLDRIAENENIKKVFRKIRALLGR